MWGDLAQKCLHNYMQATHIRILNKIQITYFNVAVVMLERFPAFSCQVAAGVEFAKTSTVSIILLPNGTVV